MVPEVFEGVFLFLVYNSGEALIQFADVNRLCVLLVSVGVVPSERAYDSMVLLNQKYCSLMKHLNPWKFLIR